MQFRVPLFARSRCRERGRNFLKKGIHPQYYQATVICGSCGTTFVTGSTKKDIRVEICSRCHPFFTGQRKFIDAEGRVQKFAKKYGLKV